MRNDDIVDYIKSKLPYKCIILYSQNKYSPTGDKVDLHRTTIVEINTSFAVVRNNSIDTAVPLDAIKKIAPDLKHITNKDLS